MKIGLFPNSKPHPTRFCSEVSSVVHDPLPERVCRRSRNLRDSGCDLCSFGHQPGQSVKQDFHDRRWHESDELLARLFARDFLKPQPASDRLGDGLHLLDLGQGLGSG